MLPTTSKVARFVLCTFFAVGLLVRSGSGAAHARDAGMCVDEPGPSLRSFSLPAGQGSLQRGLLGEGIRSTGAVASHVQVPVKTDKNKGGERDWNFEELWNGDLDARPPLSSTNNFIFDIAASLLELRPNARWKNGHTIVPATIPAGTLLYHGRDTSSPPLTSEWAALDAEYSFLYCRPACWLHTLRTTRPLRLLYFDGGSALKAPYGTMDMQDLLAWGHTLDGNQDDWELSRIKKLCEWGKTSGVDGFLRIQMNFEIMLCSFTNGLIPVSTLHLTQDFWPPYRSPSGINLSSPFARVVFEAIHSGIAHAHDPGETRVHIDYASLVTFYDQDAFPGLAARRNSVSRSRHRAAHALADEVHSMRQLVDQAVTDAWTEAGIGSGVDWRVLMRVIMDRHAGRLELLKYILAPETSREHSLESHKQLRLARAQLAAVLTPYLVADAVPPTRNISTPLSGNASWALPIFHHCARAHIAGLPTAPGAYTRAERVLHSAVREVTREICRSAVRMWVRAGDLEGLSEDPDGALALVAEWRGEVARLMAWLDWSVWVRCDPECILEEVCYFPIWPFLFHPPEEWWYTELRPRCTRRIQPYLLDFLEEGKPHTELGGLIAIMAGKTDSFEPDFLR